MEPTKIEFAIGKTIFGQPLRLTYERATDGRCAWTLYRDEANQRDDRTFISGLTDEAILNMAEAVKRRRGGTIVDPK